MLYKRRYLRGIKNLLYIYKDICDICSIVDNSGSVPKVIAEIKNNSKQLINIHLEMEWKKLNDYAKKKN